MVDEETMCQNAQTILDHIFKSLTSYSSLASRRVLKCMLHTCITDKAQGPAYLFCLLVSLFVWSLAGPGGGGGQGQKPPAQDPTGAAKQISPTRASFHRS